MNALLFGNLVLGGCLIAGCCGLLASFFVGAEGVPAISLVQSALVASGAAGFVLHAFPLHHKADEDFPNFDTVALSYLVPIVLAIFIPKLQSFEFFGLKLSVKDVAAEGAETAEEFKESLTQLSELFQYWVYIEGWYRQRLAEARDDDRAQSLLFTFVRDRLDEARNVISTSVGRPVRLSLWRYVPGDDALVFFFSNEIVDEATMQHVFARGKGLLGQAFDEGATWNEANATLLPSYEQIGPHPPPYQAVLVTPMQVGTETVGMLSLDQPGAGEFLEIDENMAKAAATVCALAMQAYLDLPGWPAQPPSSTKR